ncbi:hypothetical protein [Mesobacillus subterraneus]|uniref:Uncharacterized protein n=1 Tax=Mesobacillus subterraneus TaxID=285983 RepID=A0A3R9EBM7_9BACI|nr:hypothetical protein [Mesobacillus subterraneus]RSD28224.1 hypothetical protein EJA10_07160 [Mesobacillus subterraneus]
MYPQFMRYYLLVAVVTDIVLIIYLSTLIEEIGFMFFLLMSIVLLTGTIFIYIAFKRRNGKH